MGPAVEGAVEGADAGFGGKARGGIWHAALPECVRHSLGQGGVLGRGAFLPLAVVGDDRSVSRSTSRCPTRKPGNYWAGSQSTPT
jgi:hypothetical protein